MALTQDEIDELAGAPERVTGDEGTIKERPIKDVIAADQYAHDAAATNIPWGMRMARAKFPGTQS